MHLSRELARLFPLLEAPSPWDNVEDWEPIHADGVDDNFSVHGTLPRLRSGVAARGERWEAQLGAARLVDQVVAHRALRMRPPCSKH